MSDAQASGRARRASAPAMLVALAVSVVSLLISSGLAVGGAMAGAQVRQAEVAAARAQAAAYEAAVASCDIKNFHSIKYDEAALRAWLSCPDSAVRTVAQERIAFSFTYPIGSRGPGGGTVFYSSPTRQPWGQFLEAAPAGWSGEAVDPEARWCPKGKPGYKKQLPTKSEIGSGFANTKLIVKACGTETAAGIAAQYEGGGKADWYLPSRFEIAEMFEQRAVIDGLGESLFWSSSQLSNDIERTWANDFSTGVLGSNIKSSEDYRVRPIRAF